MLSESKLRTLNDFIDKLSREEIVWVNGYLTGKIYSGMAAPSVALDVVSIPKKFSILYGTDTGNSKKLAIEFSAIAKREGAKVKVHGMDTYKAEDLSNETNLCIIMSTHGDGDPPPSSKKFYDALMNHDSNLSKLEYSVLALGDSSYPYFCKAGEDIFHRLSALGGKASIQLQKCDVDYQNDANYWFQNYLKALKSDDSNVSSTLTVKKTSSGKKYYQGIIKNHINLNGTGSNKLTYHIEIKTKEPIEYEAGDALGVMPRNKKDTLDKIFSAVGIDGNLPIPYKGVSYTLYSLLTNKLNVSYLKESQVKKYAEIIGKDIPNVKIDLIDLVRIYPIKPFDFVSFIGYLNEMTPRLYSVCSSPNARENEVHILVSKNTFKVDTESRYGLCSDMLSDFTLDTPIEFYIHKNRQFRLPAEDTDIIMIGPGTGMAPMRAFIEERDQQSASGKNWLIFGEQHFTTDFFYQTEIQQYVSTGALHRVDLAWSRDSDHKSYVQHKMLENGKDFYDWIKRGANIYVSGSRTPMSEDVEKTIIEIISTYGGKSAPESEEYWNELKEAGIYKADVY